MSQTELARSFVIAATPRTGSTLLCEGIEATGVCGRPSEFFAPDFRPFWRAHWSLSEDASFAQFLAAAMQHGTTDNGVYGFKIQWMHVQDLARDTFLVGEYFEGQCDDVLELLFPGARYINIVRRDRRAQAISYYRALATNEWARRPTVEEQNVLFQLPPPASGPPAFNGDSIRELERDLASQQAAWERFFWKRSIDPLIVEYEALDEDYTGQIARVLAFLGADPSVAMTLSEPRLVRQADDLTRRWRRRLEAETETTR